MTETAPAGPYTYQPFGVQHPGHWKAGRIYAIGGLPELATVRGLTKDEAHKVLLALTDDTDALVEAANAALAILPRQENPNDDLQRLVNLATALLRAALEGVEKSE